MSHMLEGCSLGDLSAPEKLLLALEECRPRASAYEF